MKNLELLFSEEMSELAKRIYDRLDDRFSLAGVGYTTFANKEIKPKIPCSLRHKEVYFLHSMYHPDPNTAMMKLLLTIDAISRASAENITLVLPYMSYVRQDRKDEPRVPISARLMANMIESYPKVERILTMDLHCEQAQGFYNMPVDNLYGSLVHQKYFREKYNNDFSNVVVYSPDFGGAVRARRFARSLDETVQVFPIEKRRIGPNKAEVLNFLGNPEGKDVIIYDDMIDTGGSIAAAAKECVARGANVVYCVATHGLFSPGKNGAAEDNFKNLQVVTTESIPRDSDYYAANKEWLTVLPIDELLANAISESSKVGGSISKLFGGK